VGEGNVSALAFYRQSGFYLWMIELEQKTERDKKTGRAVTRVL